MADYREELFQSFRNAMVEKGYGSETIVEISNILVTKLNNYEITERCTDLVIVEKESEQIVKWFLGTMYTENKSPKTIKCYKDEIMKFYRFIQKPLKEATVMDFRCYFAEELKRVSETTAENKRSYLSSFYQFLTREEIILKNPMMKIKPIKHQDYEEEPYSEVEIDKIREACKTLRDRCIVELALSSGARNEEICNLDIKDVDLQKLEVIIRHGKGDKRRTSYISPLCASYLKKYMKERKDDKPYLIVNRNKNRMNKNNITYLMRKIEKETGVNNVHAHRFRRTLASTLFKRGVDIHVIQQILGHADINTTVKCYIKTNKSQIKNEYVKAM